MNFAALGRTRMLLDAIGAVTAAGHDLTLVGTCTAAPEYDATSEDFRQVAEAHGVPFFDDIDINAPRYVELAQASGAEVAISVNWSTLIRQPMLDAFRHGILNAHCGDLPRYRGNACPNWAILAREGSVVLTIHRMTEDLDAGPVLAKSPFPLSETTTIRDVYSFLAREVPASFVSVLDGLEAGSLRGSEQDADPAVALRCFPRRPSDAHIEWSQHADDIVALIRASTRPFAGAFTYIWRTGAPRPQKLTVWNAHVDTWETPAFAEPGQVTRLPGSSQWAVFAGDGALVVLDDVAVDGEPIAATAPFLSPRLRLGVDISALVDILCSLLPE